MCEVVGPTTAKCSQIAGVDTGYDYCCDCSSDDETFCSDDGLNCDCDYCQFNALNACSNPDIYITTQKQVDVDIEIGILKHFYSQYTQIQ